jgi:hypothetical protein
MLKVDINKLKPRDLMKYDYIYFYFKISYIKTVKTFNLKNNFSNIKKARKIIIDWLKKNEIKEAYLLENSINNLKELVIMQKNDLN